MRPDDPFDDAVTARAVIAADGTLARWSEGARLLLGYPAEEVVGHPVAELLAERAVPPRPRRRKLCPVISERAVSPPRTALAARPDALANLSAIEEVRQLRQTRGPPLRLASI